MNGWKRLPLLPDDVRYLRRMLSPLAGRIQYKMLAEYYLIWMLSSEDEATQHRKENAGRRAANEWLTSEVNAMREKEPETVRKYREAMATPIPKCCFTCDHYGADGKCSVFGMNPPKSFAESLDKCNDWKEELSF